MRQQSRKTNNILSLLINHILSSLDELKSGYPGDDFVLGQKYAYVECLELLLHILLSVSEAEQYEKNLCGSLLSFKMPKSHLLQAMQTIRVHASLSL